ncbi:MAG: DUF190 domain-containing protein [Chloroflexi bacterium]|nr:DUF190 domain-containing protein [Chloroflexota bacterium]
MNGSVRRCTLWEATSLVSRGSGSAQWWRRLADVAPDLPVAVEWIDTSEQVERLLPRICELVRTGTITVDDLTIVKHSHRQPPS